jgi:hypothetical protein
MISFKTTVNMRIFVPIATEKISKYSGVSRRYASILDPEDGSSTPLRNGGNYLPIQTAQHPVRPECWSVERKGRLIFGETWLDGKFNKEVDPTEKLLNVSTFTGYLSSSRNKQISGFLQPSWLMGSPSFIWLTYVSFTCSTTSIH